jgi:hypothetical protein
MAREVGSQPWFEGGSLRASRIKLIAWVSAGCILVSAVGLVLPARNVVGDKADRLISANNLKQIAVAMHKYHDAHQQLPPAVIRGPKGTPLYSWRVAILPYMGEEPLYKEFKLDEPCDAPRNKALLSRMPRVFQAPGRPRDYQTHYQVLVGPGTAFERESLGWHDFPVGLGNTILVTEGTQPVPWTKPADLVYDPVKPLPALGGVVAKVPGEVDWQFTRQEGFNAAMVDGSVRFILRGTDDRAIRALITRDGN